MLFFRLSAPVPDTGEPGFRDFGDGAPTVVEVIDFDDHNKRSDPAAQRAMLDRRDELYRDPCVVRAEDLGAGIYRSKTADYDNLMVQRAFIGRSIAQQASRLTGRTFILGDRGPSTSPRFTIIEPPKVGDAVSRSFNGDTYPDGLVTHVSTPEKGCKVVKTDTGSIYYRARNGHGAGWLKAGGTWSLVRGHHYEQNPHF